MPAVSKDLRQLARKYTDNALHIVLGVMNHKDTPPHVKLQAAGMLWDRGYGKPAQMIVGDEENGPVRLEVDDRGQVRELARRMAYLLAQADTQAIDGGPLVLEDGDASHDMEDAEDTDS